MKDDEKTILLPALLLFSSPLATLACTFGVLFTTNEQDYCNPQLSLRREYIYPEYKVSALVNEFRKESTEKKQFWRKTSLIFFIAPPILFIAAAILLK